jgi:hypothetical protein
MVPTSYNDGGIANLKMGGQFETGKRLVDEFLRLLRPLLFHSRQIRYGSQVQ